MRLQFGWDVLPRREWLLYNALMSALPDQSRRAGFGDYTVAAVEFPKGDMWFADYLKAIFAAIETQREGLPILLPLEFKLSDASVAALVNCSLDLDANDGVGTDFVKVVRERERERKGAVA